jgi:two-component system chemotaxis sensor kinase CheA
MSDDARLTFVQESEELLEQMEDALLAMEDAPDDEEHLNSVFRAMHTIKGAAGIFGFDFIVEFTHPVETRDRFRAGGGTSKVQGSHRLAGSGRGRWRRTGN